MLSLAARLFDGLCFGGAFLGLRFALFFHDLHRSLPRRLRRWRGSLRRLWQQFLLDHGLGHPPPRRRGAVPWNRTPDEREEQVVVLHVSFPHLGAGQLRWLLFRLLGWLPARETVRQIIIRRRDLFFRIVEEKKRAQRIHVSGPRHLWGIDLALVWVLGFVPVWLLGVVDYHGSRLMALELLRTPSSAEVVRVLDRVMAQAGAPERLLSDRAPIFRSEDFENLLARFGVRHVLIRPCHAWTNGRIERIWRTFRDVVRRHFWLIASRAQLDRICADFLDWYNRCRPHSSFGGRTPDEVYFGRPMLAASHQVVTFFDGRMPWLRFG